MLRIIRNGMTLSVIMLGTLYFGCSQQPTENTPAGNVLFQVKAVAGTKVSAKFVNRTTSGSGDSLKLTDPAGTVFSLSEARVHIRHVEFYLPDSVSCQDIQSSLIEPAGCETDSADSSGKIVIKGPFVFDLLSGVSTPNLHATIVPAGNYRRIDVRLDDADSTDGIVLASDELENYTMILKGTFGYLDKSDRPFSILLRFNEDARFEADSGILIQDGTLQIVTLKLDVNKWLNGVSVTACLSQNGITLDSLGNLLIDEKNGKNCSDLEGLLKSNIKNSGQLDKQ